MSKEEQDCWQDYNLNISETNNDDSRDRMTDMNPNFRMWLIAQSNLISNIPREF